MPFSAEEFFAVFAAYNTAIWPTQIVAYVAGLAAVAAVLRGSVAASRGVLLILAAMWALNGAGYHWTFFAEINPLGPVFAAAFLAEAAALAAAAVLYGHLPPFRAKPDARTVAGLALVLFAAILYPLWGALAGHVYPAVPAFGVAPCPTTIFTIGMLLMGPWALSRWLLVIPVLWSLVGGSAAVLLQVPQDYGLLASAVVVLVFAVAHWRGARFARHAAP